ncbi:acetyl-CoA synthetase-like protein [Leucogyrophana mollusca]|uniref:Acetyl-CoA synthetase-like protein n=1 Tax=Leucogyrophana mollusca TaxID=85980 RepID=A0ACB8BU92_9AGAM|nr:acetyl-CoA synthetase-like protein [Leucogyrophana mollusca]
MASHRLLDSPPQTQARSSETFRPPPLDSSLSIPELYDWHLQHTPNHRLFLYAREDGNIRTILWPEAVQAIHTGAKIIRARMGWELGNDEAGIVAIISLSDTIPYFITMMSIIRANYVVFPISPRNSAAAVAHLLDKVGVDHVLVGREQVMQDLVNDALDVLRDQYPSAPTPNLSPMFIFEDLFLPTEDGHAMSETLPFKYKGPNSPLIILHSSGSTGFPKPVPWTNHTLSQLALAPWFGECDLTGQVLSAHTIPMYHGMGMLQLLWTASCGYVVSAFEPKSPPITPTPDSLFVAAKATDSDIVFCVPTFVEAWSRNPEYVQWLSTRKGVMFGGGPLNKEVGDLLTSQGVTVFVLYGATEFGIVSTIIPAETGYDWEYIKFPKMITAKMVPYSVESNTFEFVVVSNHFSTPPVINTKIDGVDAYATSDIFVPHPTKDGYWKIFGRVDDQIMHSTGEKTNPGPLEAMLNQDPSVFASVVFGRGRFYAGVLVDPKPHLRFDPSDETRLAKFRNKIWPTIERMNAFAPQRSRLFKEMIVVSKPSRPFTYTAKGTPRRQAIIAEYEREIDALYEAVEESTQSNIAPPPRWDRDASTEYVRKVVTTVMGRTASDHDDIFQQGCDSLQATWIRNSVLRALRDSTQINTREIIHNFVVEYPSIEGLASYVLAILKGAGAGSDATLAQKVSAMRAMAQRYGRDFPPRGPSDVSLGPAGAVVLVTGTTGALGCYLLAQLVLDPKVAHIYALNRKSVSGKVLRRRQEEALADRGVDLAILDSEKITLVEGDPSLDQFGLPDDIYYNIRGSVTHIIHNAWPVNFNLALATFDANVRGLRRLIDFALTSASEPLRLVYTSSVGVFQNASDNKLMPEAPIEPEVAVGSGYTESKWVCEEILVETAKRTALKPLIVRVGQLSGGLTGAWNTNEWVPALIQSAEVLQCLPTDDKDVSWIPLHIAASAFVDLALALEVPSNHIVHIIHPRPVPWLTLASFLSSELSVALVPYHEWLGKLEAQHSEDTRLQTTLLQNLRALRLLPFFKNIAQNAWRGEAMGFPKLDVAQAQAYSTTLADPSLSQLGRGDVVAWIGYWRRNGLLSQM